MIFSFAVKVVKIVKCKIQKQTGVKEVKGKESLLYMDTLSGGVHWFQTQPH